MTRNIKSHPVEKLVKGYLTRFKSTSNTRNEKAVIDKAAKLIGISLHNPCCQPAEEVILGRNETYFIVQLRALLNGVDVRKWRESLERAKTALENMISNPCCGPNCLTANITSDVLTTLVGRDQLTYSFCSVSVDANSSNEPDLAEFLANALNAAKDSNLLPGTFTFDNNARTVTYTGQYCDSCEELAFFESITGA